MNKRLSTLIIIVAAIIAATYFSKKSKPLVTEKSPAVVQNIKPVAAPPEDPVLAENDEPKVEVKPMVKSPLLIKTPLQVKIEKICAQDKDHSMQEVQAQISSLKLGHAPDLVNLHFMHEGKRYCLQWNEEENENGGTIGTVTYFILDKENFPTKTKAPFDIKESLNITKIKNELKNKVGKFILQNEMGEISSDGENLGRYEATDGKYLKLDLPSLSCEGKTCLCH